jgi:hypothetical protein
MELGEHWDCPACHAVLRTLRAPGVTIVPTYCCRDHPSARVTRGDVGAATAERRCPSCLEWSPAMDWSRGGEPARPGVLACPACGAACAIGDTDYRFGPSEGREQDVAPGSRLPHTG